MKMNIVCVALFAFLACSTAYAETFSCDEKKVVITQEWTDMVRPCIAEVRRQIGVEFGAAIKYLAIGAHFSQASVNRPGFAKFFFDSASEEREHGIKLISYLSNRGNLTDLKTILNTPFIVEQTAFKSGEEALNYALSMEVNVTKSIQNVIKTCEEAKDDDGTKFNDYELVDYLTSAYLTEQYNGQREIAGKISTLNKMMDHYDKLGEFLFDKTLL